MVGAHHGMLDAGGGQLANRPREVVDDRVQDLPRLEREAGLARVVDLLRAEVNFFRLARSGRKLPSISAPSFPPCSMTEKLAAAPGMSAAMPIGVMLGNVATAGRTATSEVFGSRSASSTPISKRIASTRK